MDANKLETINAKLAHGSLLLIQENQISTGPTSMSTATAISAWQKSTKESGMSSSFQNSLN